MKAKRKREPQIRLQGQGRVGRYMQRVAFIIGIGGACRKIEMLKLTTDEVVGNGDYVLLSIVDTKNYEPRQFMVTAGSVN
ncbi:hypothetical protein Bhyg_02238 [Pseudolycoriella hygida]|uniref:Uncharacterized protein n=1 Tax=Pseudolycoriella hygida TaxID=35572 RepID=A0A9Q0S8D0_9DIPT|nr:hypothetical protein Bhyg_02238 [Pseudolycoriella hygida]